MERIIAALATDDGQTFVDRHFGDAQRYLIYEITPSAAKHLTTLDNSVEGEEEGHSDHKKARNIGELLNKERVQVLISKKFGANINRMKKNYVCVLMNDNQITDSVKAIQQNYDAIVEEWSKGQDRHFLNLKS